MCLHHLIVPSVLLTAGNFFLFKHLIIIYSRIVISFQKQLTGTIMMERRGIFLKVGILKSRFRSGNRISVSCIQWRILRFLRNWLPWSWHSMDQDQLELVLRFLGLMTCMLEKNQKILKHEPLLFKSVTGNNAIPRKTCTVEIKEPILCFSMTWGLRQPKN